MSPFATVIYIPVYMIPYWLNDKYYEARWHPVCIITQIRLKRCTLWSTLMFQICLSCHITHTVAALMLPVILRGVMVRMLATGNKVHRLKPSGGR